MSLLFKVASLPKENPFHCFQQTIRNYQRLPKGSFLPSPFLSLAFAEQLGKDMLFFFIVQCIEMLSAHRKSKLSGKVLV